MGTAELRVRTVAAHEVVAAVHPRPPPEERDLVGMAAGRAIDTSLAQFSHQFGVGRRPTSAGIRRLAEQVLDDELRDADVQLPVAERDQILQRIAEVIRAFRSSVLFGLPRPRSRLVLINERAGYYAQPDFWDVTRRVYEMKSYRADPAAPEIALQLGLFQLAFANFELVLARFDRHAPEVRPDLIAVPPILPERSEEVLRAALTCAEATGQEKVLRYVENPVVRYRLGPSRDGGVFAPPEGAPGLSSSGP